MIECVVYLLIWVIVAAICWYVIQQVVAIFWTPPAPVMQLIGLLLGLLVLLKVLGCLGMVRGLAFP